MSTGMAYIAIAVQIVVCTALLIGLVLSDPNS